MFRRTHIFVNIRRDYLSISKSRYVTLRFGSSIGPQIGITMDNPKKRGFFIAMFDYQSATWIQRNRRTTRSLDWFDRKFAGFNHHWKGYHVFDFGYVLESEKDPSKIQRYRVYLQEGVGAQVLDMKCQAHNCKDSSNRRKNIMEYHGISSQNIPKCHFRHVTLLGLLGG